MYKKSLLVVGGSGYVGSRVLQEASRLGWVKVTAVQKRPPAQHLPNVEFIAGNALSPDAFKSRVEEADAIIHTVGVLVDASVSRRVPPGGPGTYEEMNFETARRVGDLANSFTDKRRRMAYISASSAPPFLPRYLTTKTRAEDHIRNLPNVDAIILRPGLITDPSRRLISVLAGLTDLAYGLMPAMRNLRSVSRENVAKALLYTTLMSEQQYPHGLYLDMINELAAQYNRDQRASLSGRAEQ